MEGFRPPHVEVARKNGDIEALQRMGKKGGLAAANIRAYNELRDAENMADAQTHEENMLKDVPENDR